MKRVDTYIYFDTSDFYFNGKMDSNSSAEWRVSTSALANLAKPTISVNE